jgi:hypothetical protein
MENEGAFKSMDFGHFKIVPLLALTFLLALLITGCAAGEPATFTFSETDLLPAQPAEMLQPTAALTLKTEPTPTSTRLAGFDTKQLGNMVYQLNVVAQALPGSNGFVSLTDGHFEQLYPDSAVGVVADLVDHAEGDLNADGLDDAAALLAVNTGGTGVFMQLATVTQGSGGLSHTATLYLGDRVRVESLVIEDGVLRVRMITHSPEDPMCCPSQSITRDYILQDDLLLTPEQSQVLPLAETTIQALKTGDMAALAQLVHPVGGLRFSPYAYVLPEHLVFSSAQLPGLMDDPSIYTWGAFDGSGEPIQLTFADYFTRFVYSKDFASAEQVSLDQRQGFSNTLDNRREFYPQSVVVEYYLPGENPDYAGMDWQSLRLVFQQQDGAWYLAGVIHDEWTI